MQKLNKFLFQAKEVHSPKEILLKLYQNSIFYHKKTQLSIINQKT